MPSPDPHPPNPNPEEAPSEFIDTMAALDDHVGGLPTDLPPDAIDGLHDQPGFSGVLDLMLLLRQAGAAEAEMEPAWPVPDVIGRYRILGLAGRGGSSLVWKAYDPVLRRHVAVKVLSGDILPSVSANRRFRREAELASRLVHPSIVTIHEVGDDGGQPFIVSEFCEGGSLADWLSRHPGPVAPGIAAGVALAISRAADHAHTSGIIHRDIKPANVMLVPAVGGDRASSLIPGDGDPSSQAWNVKLGDFGLGRQERSSIGEEPLDQLTASGARVGTPAWMAPEQVDRSFGDIGPTTDVHGIGLVLHRMLTGRSPRGGTTEVETYREVLLDDPPPANRVIRKVPADLAAVCSRCLAKRPEHRYPTAAALADDLDRWRTGQPTLARPLSAVQQVGRLIARRRAMSVLAILAVAALGVAGWTAAARVRERRTAVAQEAEGRRHAAAAALRRGFEFVRSFNVAGALEQVEQARSLDATLAGSLSERWLERKIHGERTMLLQPPTGAPGMEARNRRDLHSVAVSADGRVAAIGGGDGVVRVIHLGDNAAPPAAVVAHDEINDVCLSADGRFIATVGNDGRLRWCRATSPETAVGELLPAGGPLYAVAFSADSASIVYGGADRVLRRIAIAGNEPPQELHRFAASDGNDPDIEAIACSGSTLLVACGGVLAAFAEGDTEPRWTWKHADTSRAIFHCVAVSPDGSLVAAAGSSREVGLWDTASGRHAAWLPVHPNWIQACGFSRDGSLLATACRDGVLRVFRVSTRELVARLVGHSGRLWDVSFRPDGTILTAGADGTLRLWDSPATGEPIPLRELALSRLRVSAVRDATTISGSCCVVVVGAHAAPSRIMLPEGTVSDFPICEGASNDGLAIDRVRGRVAFGLKDEPANTRPLVLPLDGSPPISPVALLSDASPDVGPYVCWTPDGHLVTHKTPRGVSVWSPSLDHGVRVGGTWSSSVRVQATSSAPTKIAVATRPGLVLRLDDRGMPDGPTIMLTDLHDQISAMEWSPDGSRLVCGLRNGAVHVLDGLTGSRIGSLASHERQIVDVAWSRDGRTVVTADAEFVRISDADTFTTFDDVRPGWTIESICLAGHDRFVVMAGMAPASGADTQARLAWLDLVPP